MTAVRLTTRRVEKPWGRRDFLPAFGDVSGQEGPVGEIWFEDPRGSDPELLVKYLFTSEKLSIQVHPDDAAARARGFRRGKEEAWLVLEADPGALIGLGLRHEVDRGTLRQAAADGTIEQLIDWRPAKAGDYYYSPAGTVHALGPGLKLIEVQQNVDLTYRLYDYGRPRELHLDDGVEVSNLAPYAAPFQPYEAEEGRFILAEGRKFVLERWTRAVAGALDARGGLWLVPIAGTGTIDSMPLQPGDVWLIEEGADLRLDVGADLLIAYAENEVRPVFL
jgi:mannose-6-phosphate isomerase